MKIYLTAAISQKTEFGIYYQRINDFLHKKGFAVESGNLLKLTEKSISFESDEERLTWYEKSIDNVNKADLVVVEISFPSTVNVGHELSVALEKGKPV
jgi:nucleoside 2-deoxyribosyltransferase